MSLKLHRLTIGDTDVSLVGAISEIIGSLLPTLDPALVEAIKDEETLEKIVDMVDRLLIAKYPPAALIPEKIRKGIIGAVLKLILDNILLPA